MKRFSLTAFLLFGLIFMLGSGMEAIIMPRFAAGNWDTIALKSDGTLWAWGANWGGGLGDGTTTDKYSPTQEATHSADWVSIAAGNGYTIAIKSDGTLWAWGWNPYGNLGDGTTDNKYSPVQIGSDKWVSISGGDLHTKAIKSDGTLWAWGYNGHGELGNGAPVMQSNSPTQEATHSTDWVSVSAGGYHTIALKSNGTLWAWGYNGLGSLGDGTTTDKNSPVQIGSDNKWISIAAGGGWGHTIALKSDGTLWAWGANFDGQLGDGTTAQRNSPTQEATHSTDWISISAGNDHTIALKSDGTLWAWGDNGYGQLGDGTIIDKHSPVQIGSDKWFSISAGRDHTIALKSDGTLWAWGDNGYGQ
jgi:alpha-tubulin suppressor-like RCC1 family protein